MNNHSDDDVAFTPLSSIHSWAIFNRHFFSRFSLHTTTCHCFLSPTSTSQICLPNVKLSQHNTR